MKLALLHYHLIRGGVTRVIENHIRSLDAAVPDGDDWHVAVLYGGRDEGWPHHLADELNRVRLSLHRVPSIEYGSRVQGEKPTPERLCDEITAALDELGFAPDDCVLHVHNHSLGKNVALPGAVRMLAERGFGLLLQPHDFAEDFRPANFRDLARALSPADPGAWHGWLYPQGPNIHYAALNGRDRRVLGTAGIKPDRLHLLSNPVPEINGLPPKHEARAKMAERFGVDLAHRLILYPVRGIRRKNLGEALLYAAVSPPGTVVGLTLPPFNPVDRVTYDQWKALAEELQLPARFELGAPGGMSFFENLAASDLIMTTSLAEGFGMVYLESWLAGRSLVGRDLPEITSDFIDAGLTLDALEPRLVVPLDWVGADALGHAVCEAYGAALEAYDRCQPTSLADALEVKTSDGLVDFGDLHEPLQHDVIRRVWHDKGARDWLLEINPALGRAFAVPAADAEELIAGNVGAIEASFSVVPSGRRLIDLYTRVAATQRNCPPEPLTGAPRILDDFLDLGRFRLIRT